MVESGESKGIKVRTTRKICILLMVLTLCICTGCSGTKKTDVITCFISISCKSLLNQMDSLKNEKREFVPENGILLSETQYEIEKGSSVFDLLQKACIREKIQMEYSDSPIYNSSYIEGIGQLYELDCGSKSGWMYSVNGEFPNYGCSKYELKPGDKVEFVYTCNLGADVRGGMQDAG